MYVKAMEEVGRDEWRNGSETMCVCFKDLIALNLSINTQGEKAEGLAVCGRGVLSLSLLSVRAMLANHRHP